MLPVNDEVLVHAFQHTVGDGSGFGFVHADQQHSEFIPAEPDHGVPVPDAPCEALGKFGEHDVPGPVPVGVVDALEIVQIDKEDPYP